MRTFSSTSAVRLPATGWRVKQSRSPTCAGGPVREQAAQHGAGWDRPQADLAAALEKFPAATWREAAALASELRATDAFSTGLRLVEAGRGVARRLRLPERRSVEVSLTAWGAPGHVKALSAVMRESGWLAKARVLLRLAIPSPASLRSHSVDREPSGLAAAYLERWSSMLAAEVQPAIPHRLV